MCIAFLRRCNCFSTSTSTKAEDDPIIDVIHIRSKEANEALARISEESASALSRISRVAGPCLTPRNGEIKNL